MTAALALAVPWLLSPKTVQRAVESRIERLADLSVVTTGDVRFALLPRPQIIMGAVSIGDREGALNISTAALRATIDLVALAAGRVEFSALEFLQPKIALDLDKEPPFPISQRALGAASVVEGAVRITTKGQTHVAEHVNATLGWRSPNEPMALTATFDLRGERIEASFWAPRPVELFLGGETLVALRLEGDNLAFRAHGQTQLGANARFAGQFSVTAASARHALALLGFAPTLPGPFANPRLSGEALVTSRKMEFTDLQIAADGNEFEGRAALRREDDRYALSATLSSRYVSAKETFSETPAFIAGDGQWSRDPFGPLDFSGVDIDLRLSAAHARVGRFTVDDATLLVTSRDGALDIELSEARAYRGALKLRMRLTPQADGIAVRADGQTRDVEAGAMLHDAIGRRIISGALDATLALDSAGGDVSTLMHSLKGNATFALTEGEIDGLDLARALRRLAQRPLASALDIRTGRTLLDRAALSATVDNGLAEFVEGAAHGPGMSLQFSGQADIAERTLLLHAAAQGGDRAAAKSNLIAFDVSGGWDDLKLKTDTRSFIRRSDAAAPLLPTEPEARNDNTPPAP